MIQWQSLATCAATTSASTSRRPTTPTRCQCARGAPSRRSCRFWRYAADSIVHKHATAARALSLLTTFGVPVRLQVVEWLVEPAIITSGEVKISFKCVVSLTLPPNCHPSSHFPLPPAPLNSMNKDALKGALLASRRIFVGVSLLPPPHPSTWESKKAPIVPGAKYPPLLLPDQATVTVNGLTACNLASVS